jgi:hypothetical protein
MTKKYRERTYFLFFWKRFLSAKTSPCRGGFFFFSESQMIDIGDRRVVLRAHFSSEALIAKARRDAEILAASSGQAPKVSTPLMTRTVLVFHSVLSILKRASFFISSSVKMGN